MKNLNDIEEYLKTKEEFENYSIEYILYNADTEERQAFACDRDENAILIKYTKETIKHNIVYDWDFSIDEYIFGELENGYDIEYISEDTIKGIEYEIEKYYPYDIEYIDGYNKWLEFKKGYDNDKRRI